MKERTLKVYNCSHCNKLYLRKGACEKHERDCFNNWANHRPCFNCSNLRKKDQVICIDYFDGSQEEKVVSAFYCDAKKIALYPPKIENRGTFYDFHSYSNEPMPKVCEIYDKEKGELPETPFKF